MLCCALYANAASQLHRQLHIVACTQGEHQPDCSFSTMQSSQPAGQSDRQACSQTDRQPDRMQPGRQAQTDSATPDATFGGISWPVESKVSAYEAVVQTLGGLSHALRDGPKHCLHHGQVLHVLMCLEKSITCKQHVASGALLCCT